MPDSYSAGRPGYNRVRVYRRTEGGPFQIAMRNRHGRYVRESLETVTGRPVYDYDLAQRIAETVAGRIAERQKAETARELFGAMESRTLGELLSRYHETPRARRKWSTRYKEEQERVRRFWWQALGKDRPLVSIEATEVEKAADRDGWSERTRAAHLKYLKAAFCFARVKLKWLDARHDLSEMDVPEAAAEGPTYTLAQIRKLVAELEKRDLRAAAIAEICLTTGRRLTAVRTLTVDTYRTGEPDGEDFRYIEFPAATDKARRRGQTPLRPRGVRLLDALLETPAVRASGLLFPGGKLADPTPEREPVSRHALHFTLRRAEKRLGIAQVRGRGWHAFKRAFTTLAKDLDAASEQSGTARGMLEKRYRFERMDLKRDMVEHLDKMLGGA